jgi:hypothetical protein
MSSVLILLFLAAKEQKSASTSLLLHRSLTPFDAAFTLSARD